MWLDETWNCPILIEVFIIIYLFIIDIIKVFIIIYLFIIDIIKLFIIIYLFIIDIKLYGIEKYCHVSFHLNVNH